MEYNQVISALKKEAKTVKERQVYVNTDEKSSKKIAHSADNRKRAAKAASR